MGTAIRSALASSRVLLTMLSAALLLMLTTAPVPAAADSASVTVSASIAPIFELTMLTDGEVSFGELEIGRVYTSPEVQRFRVRSSRPYSFSDSSDAAIALGSTTVARDAIVRHSVTPGFSPALPGGITDFAVTYLVDLTTPEALDLDAGTTISTRFGYTFVQQ
jgi:hypothetical protein